MPLVKRAHSPGTDDEGAGREAGAEEASVRNRDQGRAAGVQGAARNDSNPSRSISLQRL